ncbi:hypothetical protein [Oceanobacillus jordanicus]|uniref:Uncharacterized protein n=1 Tax=Oceanobacillus jordanicus TaxID=2867266 RepID=A0AAW5B3Z9_9BACI|nr:hypothetical protein [Oceanobacillus jordanicus]MCG3418987.1 hypothetical protein [Oceanobacillus jordanicus]
MEPVKLPKDVANALDFHYNQWKTMSRDSINLMLMAIPVSMVHGPAQIIKEYAKDNPTTYLRAILHGYIPEIDLSSELEKMIKVWLDKPYVDNEQRDISNFAKMVTKLFQQ